MEAFDQVLTPAEQSVLNDLETSFATNSTDALQTVINQEVKVTLQEIAMFSAETIGSMDEEMVSLRLGFTTGIPGSAQFFLGKTLTAKVVDFMIMGDGDVEFMPEEHLDGIVEALNQMMGGFLTELTGRLGEPVEVSGDQAELVKSAPLITTHEGHVVARFQIELENQPPFNLYKIYSRDAVAELASRISQDARPEKTGSSDAATPVKEAEFTQFSGTPAGTGTGIVRQNDERLGLVMDLSLPITIELGRTRMLIRDVVKLGVGSIIELNKLSGEPVDIFINEKKFARGEVVVIEENFGVRITEIIPAEERLDHLVEL